MEGLITRRLLRLKSFYQIFNFTPETKFVAMATVVAATIFVSNYHLIAEILFLISEKTVYKTEIYEDITLFVREVSKNNLVSKSINDIIKNFINKNPELKTYYKNKFSFIPRYNPNNVRKLRNFHFFNPTSDCFNYLENVRKIRLETLFFVGLSNIYIDHNELFKIVTMSVSTTKSIDSKSIDEIKPKKRVRFAETTKD
jgi:hypothetical protein